VTSGYRKKSTNGEFSVTNRLIGPENSTDGDFSVQGAA